MTITENSNDLLSMLTQLAIRCYEQSRSGALSQKTRTEFARRATTLRKQIDVLECVSFHERTEELLHATTSLRSVTSDISTRLDELLSVVNSINTIAEVLKLVDQAIVIAAGLAKTV